MLQYALTFRDSLETTATSEATGFDACRCDQRDAPFRQWRSTSKSEQTVTMDFGSAGTIAGIGLQGVNFPQCKIQIYDGTWKGLPGYSADTQHQMTKDIRHRCYKFSVTFSQVSSYSQARIIIGASQTTFDGGDYYEVGTFFVAAEVETMVQNPRVPVEVTMNGNQDIQETASGSVEKHKKGHPFLEMTFSQNLLHDNPDQLTQWEELAAWDDAGILWFRNRGNPQEMYWADLMGTVTIRDNPDGTYSEVVALVYRTKV